MDRRIAALEATRLANLLNADYLWVELANNQSLLEEALAQVQEAHTRLAEWIRDYVRDRETRYDAWIQNAHNWHYVIRDVNEVRARHGLPEIKGRK